MMPSYHGRQTRSGIADVSPERTLKRPHRFLSAEEVQRLIASSREPTRTIVILATMTGWRIGEILALRWGRIDLLRGTLLVAETCYKGHFGTPETRASRREVPLAPAVVHELKERYIRSADHSPSALVFGTREGAPLAADNLRKKSLRTACKRAGLQRIDWHGSARYCMLKERRSRLHKLNWGILNWRQLSRFIRTPVGAPKRRCEHARRSIVPKCSQVGW
jgi:integrase